MDNYKSIEAKLRNRIDFRGNSMSGHWADKNNFEVYSYRTRIAIFNDGDGIQIDSKKYSTTTSRHQNLVRKAWGVK